MMNKEIKAFIANADEAELQALATRINFRRKELEARVMQELSVGDYVKFEGRRHRIEVGHVTGFTRSKVKVMTKAGVPWRVPALMLTRI